MYLRISKNNVHSISCIMRIVYIALLSVLLTGCFNPTMMIDKRTALEQELTRVAILRAVSQLPILKDVLDGRWKIEVVSPNKIDDNWTRAQLRQRLASLGANISTNASENLPVVEAVIQFAGSDIDSLILGIPIPGTLGSSSISFYHENTERGRARIQLNFWTNDGKLLAQSPAASGETHYSDITVLIFIGPFSFTDLNEVKTYGRFMEKGMDGWESSRRIFTRTDATTSDAWIPAENLNKHFF